MPRATPAIAAAEARLLHVAPLGRMDVVSIPRIDKFTVVSST